MCAIVNTVRFQTITGGVGGNPACRLTKLTAQLKLVSQNAQLELQ